MKRSEVETGTRPARGTRPANRRELIVAAAAELFARNGYADVAMKDVAEAVAIGPSALYRHFASKQDLLQTVVADAITVIARLLDDLPDNSHTDPAADLAALILHHRRLGALWHVEARHLSDEARTELRHSMRRIGLRLRQIVQRQRPGLNESAADLIAWCVLSVTASVSFHGLRLPDDRFRALIAEMNRSAMGAAVPHLSPRAEAAVTGRDGARSWAPNRREAILVAATELFARNGFASVGVEDIGARVNIAGPSIYNHFDGKADILAAALVRGNELLRADLYRQFARADGPRDALNRLVASYGEFVFENPALIRLLMTETDQLPPDQRQGVRAAQREYISDWVQLLRTVRPEWGVVECRIRVQTSFIVMDDGAATPHLRLLDDVVDAVTTVATSVLGVG